MNLVTLDGDCDGLQPVARTGPGNTLTGVDHKQRVVCCALDQRFVQIKKLVFLPFQVGAGMWAIIVISKELAVFMYHKNRLCFSVDFDFETFAAGVFDITGFAENVCHDVW